MIVHIIITLIVVLPISIAWANGIENNKDYKGEDFLNQVQRKKNKCNERSYNNNNWLGLSKYLLGKLWGKIINNE